MNELAEFRVDLDFAPLLFKESEGRIGIGTQAVVIPVDDPRFREVGRLQSHLRATQGKPFFYGWDIRRTWSREEWHQAEAALLVPSTFEPCGEQCGTVYDESRACKFCGCCAEQASDLVLDLRRTPKSKDIAQTIANEVILSQSLAERLVDGGLTGFELRPVRHKARYQDDPIDFTRLESGKELLAKAERSGARHGTWQFTIWLNRPENRALADGVADEYVAKKLKAEAKRLDSLPVWYQLIVKNHRVEISNKTRVGIGPFDDDPEGKHRCPLGHKAGLNVLSQLAVERSSLLDLDIQTTNQFVGTRRGLLRPYRLMIISRRFLDLVRTVKPRGTKLEVVSLT